MQFTIVIPTRNRRGLLLRQLRHYYEHFAVERMDSGGHSSAPRIIVADSSDPGQQSQMADLPPGLVSGIYTYPPSAPVHEKLHDVLAVVKTPLVVIGADDDVFDVDGLREAAGFLSHHPGYTSCSGQIVTVDPSGSIAHYPQMSIERKEPLDRLTDHLSRYSTKWYSMQWTADVRRYYAVTLAAQVDETHIGELLPGCLSVMAGKSKVLDSFYMVRRVWPDRKKPMTKEDLIERPGWRGERCRFTKELGLRKYDPVLDLWLYAPKRSWLRCSWDNWRAKRWSVKVEELSQ